MVLFRRRISDGRAASHGRQNVTVFYRAVDESCRRLPDAGVGERHGLVSDFSRPFLQRNAGEKYGGITPWRSGRVTNAERFGGNLAGIRSRLPYLKELGINGVYLNPIMEAESNHKYDTTDYTRIDPHFGTNEEFASLVQEAHRLGIRVMVDAVFNHCGRNFAPWISVQEHGKESPYAGWFMVNDWADLKKQRDTRDGRFYSFAFVDRMPKLNTNHEEVIRYFCDVCERWIREFDIDGIRFDVGNEVSHKFLKRIRHHVTAVKPDVYLLGEIWHDASPWLAGDEYDAVMNYPLMSGICDFFLDGESTKEDFEYTINRCYTMYMQQTNNVLFNLLDSHDTERLRNRLCDLDIFYQQLAVLFTMPGSPCIYYGTEIALEGGHDPDCRRCMPWEELETLENQARIGEIRTLIALRRKEAAFRSLHFHFPDDYEQKRMVHYRKLDEAGDQVEDHFKLYRGGCGGARRGRDFIPSRVRSRQSEKERHIDLSNRRMRMGKTGGKWDVRTEQVVAECRRIPDLPAELSGQQRGRIGDIPGIIKRLDYLKELGVDALWLSPVCRSPQDDNGYDISDYQDIAAMFGSLSDMEELIGEAKLRGIRIIMDLVLNHSSDEHPWFLEAKKSRDNPYHDYYVWRDGEEGVLPNDMGSTFGGSAWEWVPEVGQYYFHQFSVKQPDLNWENPKLRREIYDMILWWMDKGVGGFRLDVIDQIAKEPDQKITSNGPRLREFIRELSRETFQKGDLITVGEAWGADIERAKLYSNPDGSEFSMVFQFEHMMLDQQPGKEKWDVCPLPFVALKQNLAKWQTKLHGCGWNSLFWNNHDLPRIVSRWGNDGEYRIKSAKMLATNPPRDARNALYLPGRGAWNDEYPL